MIDYTPVKALTFDCYGTLIDWETGILASMGKVRDKVADDDVLLELFATHEHRIEAHHPGLLYSDVLKEVYKSILSDLAINADPADIDAFGKSVGSWPAFDDTVEALRILGRRFSLVIISNIDNHSIAHSLKKLEVPFYRIFTAQDMGFYKPDVRVFGHVINCLADDGIDKDQIVHVAQSLFHDHGPAAQLGLKRVWINRRWLKSGEGATPAADPCLIPEDTFPDLITFAQRI